MTLSAGDSMDDVNPVIIFTFLTDSEQRAPNVGFVLFPDGVCNQIW